MNNRKLNLIFTNDDGVNSDGIISLYKVFSEDSDDFVNKLVVIAPNEERSVSGHSITYKIPVKIKNLYSDGKLDIYEATGSPADCVIIGSKYLLPDVDLVVSGINRGPNLGYDLSISGTVSAAIEAFVNNIKSISVSLFQYNDPDYSYSSLFIYKFVKYYKDVMDDNLFDKVFLNINFPAFEKLKKDSFPIITIHDFYRHKAELEPRLDPKENRYFWIYWKLHPANFDDSVINKIQNYLENYDKDNNIFITDIEAVFNGYISISPLIFDFNLFNTKKNNYIEVFKILKEIAKKTYQETFEQYNIMKGVK
ncbi:MAG: 5'/3'-nucleotidase SurE [bacterium]|nr:5'/3'-nucleotidase SurE [bacterium]